MAKYALTNSVAGSTQQAITSTFKTLISIAASTVTALRRGKVYDLLVGTNGTPADNYMVWDVSRSTATGTATALVPRDLDPADAAALCAAGCNHTVEPTYTADTSVFYIGVNQRASYRWVAAPGGELLFPATADNGLGLRTLSGGYTGTVAVSAHYEEQ
jgi:hypothetical protein